MAERRPVEAQDTGDQAPVFDHELDGFFERAEMLAVATAVRYRAEHFDERLAGSEGHPRPTRRFAVDDSGPSPHRYMHRRLTQVPTKGAQGFPGLSTAVLRYPLVRYGDVDPATEERPLVPVEGHLFVSCVGASGGVTRAYVGASAAFELPDGYEIPHDECDELDVASLLEFGATLPQLLPEDIAELALLLGPSFEPAQQDVQPAAS